MVLWRFYGWHPYWKDKAAYDSMIISQENAINSTIPEKCPLRKEDYTTIIKLDI